MLLIMPEVQIERVIYSHNVPVILSLVFSFPSIKFGSFFFDILAKYYVSSVAFMGCRS